MEALSIPDLECQYYDYSQAAAFFTKIGCINPPQLGVLEYHDKDETFQTVGWCSEEDDQYQDVPLFKSFRDKNEYNKITFTPMDEHEIFLVDERLYITVSVPGGLGVRRINLLFDESIVSALNSIRGMPQMEYELCRIYTIERQRQLIGLYWVGRRPSLIGHGLMTISPVFCNEGNIFKNYDISQLDIVEVEQGETIFMNSSLWQVSHDKQYGTTIVCLMNICEKHMLN